MRHLSSLSTSSSISQRHSLAIFWRTQMLKLDSSYLARTFLTRSPSHCPSFTTSNTPTNLKKYRLGSPLTFSNAAMTKTSQTSMFLQQQHLISKISSVYLSHLISTPLSNTWSHSTSLNLHLRPRSGPLLSYSSIVHPAIWRRYSQTWSQTTSRTRSSTVFSKDP